MEKGDSSSVSSDGVEMGDREKNERVSNGGYMSFLKYFTVEPALFLYMVSSFLHLPVFQALIYEKSCLDIYHGDFELCTNDTATHRDLKIQSEANFVFMLSSICFNLPSFISTIFLGSYGDRRSRKLVLLLPYLGLVLSDISYILQATYMRFNVYFLLISDFLFALFGGYSGIISTSFSYGAQMTATSNRTYRMAFLEGCIGVGGTLGYLLSGIILNATGYRWIFLINMILHCLAFFYICIRATDSPDQIEQRREKQGSPCVTDGDESASSGGAVSTQKITSGDEEARKCCWWFRSYFTDAVSVLRPRTGRKRTIIGAVLAAFSVSFLVFSGSQDIMFYYLKHQLNWSSSMYGVFRAVYFGSSSAMILFLFPFLKYQGVADWKLSAIGLVSRLIGSFMLCFPFSTWFVFCVSIFYMFNRFAATGMRSIASQQVEKDEQGKLFAAIAVIETICSLLASIIFNNLYSLSLSFYAGFPYALMAALMIIPLSFIFFIGMRLNRSDS